MNKWLHVIVFLFIAVITASFLRAFVATHAKTYLFYGLGGLLAMLSLFLGPLIGDNRFGITFVQIIGFLCLFFFGLGLAWSYTIESGLGKKKGGNFSLFLGWLPGRVPRSIPGESLPTVSHREGIFAGLLFIVAGLLHHLFFPWGGGLAFSITFAWVGLAILILSIRKLK